MLIDKNNNNKIYKVKADKEDWRDFLYLASNEPLRETVDMRGWCSPVEDQRQLGSCTGNAVAGAYELLLNKEVPDKFADLSRLYVYYNARLLEGNGATELDEGAYVRDAIKAVHLYGICTESCWPYNIEKFSIRPDGICYDEGKLRNIKNYYRLLGLSDILDSLNNYLPVVYGIKIYPGFDDLEYGKDFILSLPGKDEQPIGGHAMCFVGYDLKRELILSRNSFGADWCMKGYCWIPFKYATEQIMDSWVFDIDLK